MRSVILGFASIVLVTNSALALPFAGRLRDRIQNKLGKKAHRTVKPFECASLKGSWAGECKLTIFGEEQITEQEEFLIEQDGCGEVVINGNDLEVGAAKTSSTADFANGQYGVFYVPSSSIERTEWSTDGKVLLMNSSDVWQTDAGEGPFAFQSKGSLTRNDNQMALSFTAADGALFSLECALTLR